VEIRRKYPVHFFRLRSTTKCCRNILTIRRELRTLKLYCDEDIGTRVPKALKLVGLRAESAVSRGMISEPDVQWLQRVGQKRWLGISCNKNVLQVPEERDAIITYKVGIIFFTSGNLTPKEKLLIILRKWDWMEQIDENETRPFAYHVNAKCQIRKVL
jgi:ribosomal protein L34